MKQNFYFTFGQKYADEPHPTYPKADPQGWVRVQADSYDEARNFAYNNLFDVYFSMMYTEKAWEPYWFPKGEIELFVI